MTPLQAYDMERKLAFDDTRENFVIRYEHIKSVLTKHAEFEQLEKLEEIRNAFEKKKNRQLYLICHTSAGIDTYIIRNAAGRYERRKTAIYCVAPTWRSGL